MAVSEPTVRVSCRVFLAAIADAIDYEQSFLDGHDGQIVPGTGCCDRGERCQAYRDAAALLASYRRAQAAARRRLLPRKGRLSLEN